MKPQRLLMLIFIAILIAIMVSLSNIYVRGSSEYNSWVLKIPDKISEMKFVDVRYENYSGEVLVVYSDDTGETYCWGTGIYDVSAYQYYNQLSTKRYIVAKKDGKKIGIFQIK